MNNQVNKTSPRIIEIDFYRGLALFVIFWNHLNRYCKVGIPISYGFSDAAAVFIFLSGYVSGLVYWKTYLQKGFKGTFLKAVKRAIQIYTAHIIALTIVVIISLIFPAKAPTELLHSFLLNFHSNHFGIILSMLSLQYFPPLFDILPLYVFLILLVPFVLYIFKIDWKLTLFVSFLLYLLTQLFPQFDLHNFNSCWSLNPLSWLFLFVTAMIIGIKNRDGSLNIPIKSFLLFFAGMFLVYSFLNFKTIEHSLEFFGSSNNFLKNLFPNPFPLIQKGILQPVFLIHFLFLAYFFYSLNKYLKPFIHTKIGRLLVLNGKRSLIIFSVDVVLNYLFTYLILSSQHKQLTFYFFAFLGWTINIILGSTIAYISNKINSQTNQDIAQSLLNFQNKELG